MTTHLKCNNCTILLSLFCLISWFSEMIVLATPGKLFFNVVELRCRLRAVLLRAPFGWTLRRSMHCEVSQLVRCVLPIAIAMIQILIDNPIVWQNTIYWSKKGILKRTELRSTHIYILIKLEVVCKIETNQSFLYSVFCTFSSYCIRVRYIVQRIQLPAAAVKKFCTKAFRTAFCLHK